MQRLALILAIVAACGDDDGDPVTPDGTSTPDAFVAPACTKPETVTWFAPKPGDAKNWDIQVTAPTDTTAARAMYILELFRVVPAPTTITYADSTTVAVPAGAQATAIAD